MPFIGNKPSAVPLTSADITDGIITNADISSTAGITLNKISGNPNFRNRIINGDMQIDQRNNGASVTIGTGALYTVDRWFAQGSVTSKFTAQQSSTAPTGFINSLLFTSSAATTPSSSDYYYFAQSIEGLNCTDLAWGTANAKTVTLSFWVRSSLTGTFSGAVLNSAVNRSYAFTFTINSANTFEYKTVTIAGDTSGTWLTTNGIGLLVRFALGAGSSFLKSADSWGTGNVVGATGTTQLISTNGATFYITGVQLEAGEQASGFEFMPIDVDLQRCLRYFQTFRGVDVEICQGGMTGATQFIGVVSYLVEMRATPTFTASNGTNYFRVYTTGGSNPSTISANNLTGKRTMSLIATTPSSLTAGQAGTIRCFDASATVDFSAEL